MKCNFLHIRIAKIQNTNQVLVRMEGLELSTLLGVIGSDTITLEYGLAVS